MQTPEYNLPPANLLILGLPGSGKTTLAELMVDEDADLQYVSVGQLSRDLPVDDPRRQYVDNLYIEHNRPVGDPSFFVELVRPAVEEARAAGKGVILDGLPKKPDELEPLNRLLEASGVKIDGVVICEVSPFTALNRVMNRGDREGGLDTIRTAINRGEVYWDSIEEFREKLGGFLGARIISVDTEHIDPENAARTAREVLDGIRSREASTTVVDVAVEEVTVSEEYVSRLWACYENDDLDAASEILGELFVDSKQRPFIEAAVSAGEKGIDPVEAIQDVLERSGEYKYVPHLTKRYAAMLSRNFYDPLRNLAHTIPQEVSLRTQNREDPIAVTVAVLREALVCQQIIQSYQSKVDSIRSAEEFVNAEFEIRKDDLDYVEGYLKISGALPTGLSIRHLMRFQPDYWNIFTSSNLVGAVDGNYQKALNGQPGTHHSLSLPVSMQRRMVANSVAEYQPFIEAVSSSERSGFNTSLGFLHVVGIDSSGRAFQVEWPILMHDARLANHPNPLMRDMLARGQEIYFNHDLWHNMVPVYAESFNLYHPHAPIAYGGLLENYIKFGKALRQEKEEYEIFVAKSHAEAQQYRMQHDEEYRRSQLGAALTIINDIPHLHQQLVASDSAEFADNATRYFLTVTVGRLLNIFPPDDQVLDPIVEKLDEDPTLHQLIGNQDILRLFFTQRIALASRESRLSFMQDLIDTPEVTEDTREFIIGGLLPGINATEKRALSDETVVAICNDSAITAIALRYVEPDNPMAESGARELYDALESIGLGSVISGNADTASLQGINLLRWLAIIAPQRAPLKGHMEKVHGKEGVVFGAETLAPAEVVRRHTEAILADKEVYDYRKWAREYSQSLSLSIYDLLLNDGQQRYRDERTTLYILANYSGVGDDDKATIVEGIKSLDLLLDQLVQTNYDDQDGVIDSIQALSNVCRQYSPSLSTSINEIVKKYKFLKQQENAYQEFASTNYTRAKESIESSTMNLLATK